MDNVKTVETPYNNAVAVINRVNQLLLENNIKDSTGEAVAQFDATPSNPAWLFALACGSLHTAWQEKLSKAYSALDSQNCEDDQVLVLASLAGIKRGNGTPTHIMVLLENTGENSIVVPIGTTFTETYANQTWVLNKNVSLAAGAKQYVTIYTTVDGEYNVPSGTTFNYDGELTITCKSVSDSTGGTNIESLSSLRNRISQGEEATNFIAQAKTAIELLGGIESCSIWFNTSSEYSLTIGQGTSSRISVRITNEGQTNVTIPAGTIFTDTTEYKDWVLQNKITLVPGENIVVGLYSALGEEIDIAANIPFTCADISSITCRSTTPSVYGSIIIPPRTAYVSIKGYDYSGKVAETYYSCLDVPATVGDQQEEYNVGQQTLQMNFDYAEENTIKIYVTMKASDMAVGAEGAVKKAIMAHSGTLACGEDVTSQMVSEWVQNLGYGTVVDCSVGTPTGMISNISPTEYCVFNEDSITVGTI